MSENREIVIPGQLVGEGVKCDNSCYLEGGKVYSLVRGLVRMSGDRVSIIPVSGPYMPKVGDMVIGTIVEDFGKVYLVDTKTAYYSVVREERDDDRRSRNRSERRPQVKYNIGDLVSGKISSVDELHESQLTGVWKLEDGLTMEVDPKKVPRVIGKHRSMINQIKDKTGCNIAVGQNGIIWLKGGKTNIAIEAIRKVEAEAHTSGLTDRITQMLDEALSRSNKE
ncbi:MAG: exosome complex protein Rrp4 [Candidatus Altiarchaeota archaeon]